MAAGAINARDDWPSGTALLRLMTPTGAKAFSLADGGTIADAYGTYSDLNLSSSTIRSDNGSKIHELHPNLGLSLTCWQLARLSNFD